MLSKYPVIGGLAEYKVDIHKHYTGLGCYGLEAVVYKYDPNKLFFKYKKLYEYHVRYTDNIGKYVELAKAAVNSYEEKILTDKYYGALHDKGIEEFEQWNGEVK